MRILVINSGSSSIKFRLYDMEHERLLVSGLLERIGETDGNSVFHAHTATGDVEHQESSPIADHAAGLKQIFAFLQGSGAEYWIASGSKKTGSIKHSSLKKGSLKKASLKQASLKQASIKSGSLESLSAIGHRVVHGGETFQTPTRIDDDVIKAIQDMLPLAPLHNPANLTGILEARRLCPEIPQVAVFDTAFFHSLPPHAYRYALPDEFYQQHQVRRYGFHGTSHQHVARQAADYFQQPINTLRLITLHLGNGASAAAIHNGICIDTSMGMTPLEGLIMGTRCGDLDPSVHFYLARTLGMTLDEIETLLNHDSGMKGLCGVSDMREVHRLADQGDERARLAIEMYCYRISKYIGAYTIALGGLDALVFTGGVGENDPRIRQSICEKLSALGVALNHNRNQMDANETFEISAENSNLRVLIAPANEELEIARQTASLINKAD
jgi:acetate kinase